jgi:hypothetical protein
MKNIILFIFLIVTASLFAHSGRTDKNGGHHDRINGGYHYHNNGNVKSDYNNSKNYYSNNSNYRNSSNWWDTWWFWGICIAITLMVLYVLESLVVFNKIKEKIQGLLFLFGILGALFFAAYAIYLMFQ